MKVKKHIFYVLAYMLTILFFVNSLYAQNNLFSYQELREKIDSKEISDEEKLECLDIYLEKAIYENNPQEEYYALRKKVRVLSIDHINALNILTKMQNLLAELKDEELEKNFYGIADEVHYRYRAFDRALEYALKGEQFNLKRKDYYNANYLRVGIANIYAHTKHYSKAIEYYSLSLEYYKENINTSYNHLLGYITSLHGLGKTYWQTNNQILLNNLIIGFEKGIELLNEEDKIREIAYLNTLKGGASFLENDYEQSKRYLLVAAMAFENDFYNPPNQHFVYLYLGKIAWQQGEKEEAVAYFKKIDEFYQKNKFLDQDLREAYSYLVSYYEDIDDIQAKEAASAISNKLDAMYKKEQRDMALTLKKNEHTQFGNGYNIRLWQYVVGGVLLLLILGYWYNRKRRNSTASLTENEVQATTIEQVPTAKEQSAEEISKVSDEIVENAMMEDTTEGSENTSHELGGDEEEVEVEALRESSEKDQRKEYTFSEERVLRCLQQFEERKQFLGSVNLNQLVEAFGVNRTTISKVINQEYGKKFNKYINDLRIQQFLKDVDADPADYFLSKTKLSKKYGFKDQRTFLLAFYEYTDKGYDEYYKGAV